MSAIPQFEKNRDLIILWSGKSPSSRLTSRYTVNLTEYNIRIDEEKLERYCLNPLHPVGKHKARVFGSALGLTESDAKTLKRLILEGTARGRWSKGMKDRYGQRYVCDISCNHAGSSETVRCAWICLEGTKELRLTTCYVKR